MSSEDATYIGLVISVGFTCLIVSLFVLFGKPIEIEASPTTKMLVKQVFETIGYYLKNPFELFISPYFLMFIVVVSFPILRGLGVFDLIFERVEKKSTQSTKFVDYALQNRQNVNGMAEN